MARLLVLGGTAWLGGEIVAAALRAGHEVTCLARGEAGAAPAGARLVRADRDRPGAYDEVARGPVWDAVVDVARRPGHVRGAVAALEPACRTYVFVSTGNVYADHATPGADESAALREPLAADAGPPELYGEAKVACEAAVLAAFGPGRALLARAGLIGGPGDPFDRSGYWPLRFARPAGGPDGPVLVPDAAGRPTQLVDVRDLAAWLAACAAAGTPGVVDAVGETLPLGDHLALARAVAGHAGPVVAAPEAWLLERGVQPWMGERSLPLWLPDPDWAGFAARSGAAARALGLRHRPLAETLADTLAWELARDPAPAVRRAGLTDADERALLGELAG